MSWGRGLRTSRGFDGEGEGCVKLGKGGGTGGQKSFCMSITSRAMVWGLREGIVAAGRGRKGVGGGCSE